MGNSRQNFIYQSSYQILLIILPFITAPYIARVLDTSGIGIYSYSCAIVSYFTLFTMLGIRTYGNREVAKRKNNQNDLNFFVSNIYFLHCIIGCIVLIFYFIFVFFIIKKNKNIFLIQSISIIASILDINWLFFGLEKFKLTVIRNIIIKLLSVASIFIFVKTNNDIYIYVLIMTLSTFFEQITLWLMIKKYISFIKPDITVAKQLLCPMFLLFIPSIAINIYKQMDKIMLGIMSSYEETGIYEYAEKIINIPIGIISALGIIMMPRMSNLYASKKDDIAQSYIEFSLRFIMFISLACTAGLIGVANDFIPLFLGIKFIECISVIYILSISVIFIAWANVIRTQYLLPKSKDNVFICSILGGAIINIIINLICIPFLGAKGAAIGTLTTEVIVCLFQTLFVWHDLSIKCSYFIQIIWFTISSVIMLFVIKFISVFDLELKIKLFFEIMCESIIYFILNTKDCLKINRLK